jgi:hypothetical protein
VPGVSEETPHRSINRIPSTAQQRHFCIELRGRVDQRWMAAFDPESFSCSDKVTMIEVLADQAALRGILNSLWDLNLDIISVIQIESPAVRCGGK